MNRNSAFDPKWARLAAIVMVAVFPFPAAAQEKNATIEVSPDAGAWIVNCSAGGGGAAFECQMSQNLTEAKTGQRVLTVTVRKQASDGSLAMLLALPHGLFLPAGATYQVDGGQTIAVAIQTSDQNGAYAAVPMNAGFVAALKKGTSLNVGMESVTRKPVRIPVTLAGFTAAMEKLNAVK